MRDLIVADRRALGSAPDDRIVSGPLGAALSRVLPRLLDDLAASA